MSCRSGATGQCDFAPDGKSIYYSRENKDGSLLYQHVLGTRPSQDKLLFGHEFHDEPLGPIDLFVSSITDDGRYLVVDIQRGVPAKREDIVFQRSDETELDVPGAGVGAGITLRDDLCETTPGL